MDNKTIGYIINETAHINESKPKILKFDSNSERMPLLFETILQTAGHTNRNGRDYPKNVIEASASQDFVQERMKSNKLFGESCHPVDLSPQRQVHVDPNNISHLIKEMRWEGNNFIGVIETSATAVGQDFKNLIVYNEMVPSFSLRAMAGVKREGKKQIVQSPMRMITYDSVTFPSHKEANMTKMVTEIVKENAILVESAFSFNDLKDLINGSENAKIMTENVDIENSNIKLSEDGTKVMVCQEGQACIVSFLEEFKQKEIRDYLLKLG